VEFSAEDATRSDWAFLARLYQTAIEAGAAIVNVPDTVGYTTPSEYAALITYLRENVPDIDKAVISVHCHDDLGLSVANSLAAVEAGAGQVECTVNGLGERAGNAAMEEIVMALATRSNHYKAATDIDTQQIYRVSRLVSSLTGVNIHPVKAVVGENAFAHESGIHQHGVLSNPLTYEIMTPETVGISSNAIILGKHSGRHAFAARLQDMGYDFDQEKINQLFGRFKELADHKKNISDRDIEALVSEKAAYRPEWFRLVSHQEHSSSGGRAIGSVILESSSGVTEEVCFGEGPVDAAYKAVEKAVGFAINLKDFQLKAVTGGVDALGESTVLVERDGKRFYGRGLSTNIIEASIRAYVNAINSMIAACGFPGEDGGSEGDK
jgi:2-isopropylmalate synthase